MARQVLGDRAADEVELGGVARRVRRPERGVGHVLERAREKRAGLG